MSEMIAEIEIPPAEPALEPVIADNTVPETESGSSKAFHLKLPAFEGPLDLLLHLIRKQKIDIYDIPILEITHQYLECIDFMKELDLEIAGEFLVMAATLIHIKSRMLLPPDEAENEEAPEDPRAELVRRLLEYQSYQETSKHFRKREETWKNVYHRSVPIKDDFGPEPEQDLFDADVFDLIKAFKKLLEKVPAAEVEITRETLTVTDRINYIAERLENEKDGVRFEDLFNEEVTRVILIVTFLATLELVRLGLVKIYQEQEFGQIWLLNPGQHNETEAPGSTEDADQEAVTV